MKQNDADKKKLLTPQLRNEISRAYVTHIFAHISNPRKDFLTRAAKILVKKYSFLKDIGDYSSGYVSKCDMLCIIR